MNPSQYLRSCCHNWVHVCLRNGTLYSGLLMSCDNYMNLHLVDVTIYTPGDSQGTEPKKQPSVCLRGNMVRFVSMPDTILETVQARRKAAIHEQQEKMVVQGMGNRPRGGRGGRGGGYGGRGRGRGGGHRQEGFVPRENYNKPDHWV